MKGNHLMQRRSCGHVMNCRVAECGFMLSKDRWLRTGVFYRQTDVIQVGLVGTMQPAQIEAIIRNLHEFTSLAGASIECRSAMAQKVGLKWDCCFIHVVFMSYLDNLGMRKIVALPWRGWALHLLDVQIIWFQCGVFSYTSYTLQDSASSQARDACLLSSVEVGESRTFWQGYTASLFACLKKLSPNLKSLNISHLSKAPADSGSNTIAQDCRRSKVSLIWAE